MEYGRAKQGLVPLPPFSPAPPRPDEPNKSWGLDSFRLMFAYSATSKKKQPAAPAAAPESGVEAATDPLSVMSYAQQETPSLLLAVGSSEKGDSGFSLPDHW